MSDTPFRPTLYLNHRCPFCLKLVMYLSNAGLLDRFDMDVFEPGSEDEQRIRGLLSPHFEKVTFPAAQVAPGEYMKETDDLIARFEKDAPVKASELPLMDYYTSGVLQQIKDLFMENMALKKQLA